MSTPRWNYDLLRSIQSINALKSFMLWNLDWRYSRFLNSLGQFRFIEQHFTHSTKPNTCHTRLLKYLLTSLKSSMRLGQRSLHSSQKDIRRSNPSFRAICAPSA